jgi:hypothetical protein
LQPYSEAGPVRNGHFTDRLVPRGSFSS